MIEIMDKLPQNVDKSLVEEKYYEYLKRLYDINQDYLIRCILHLFPKRNELYKKQAHDFVENNDSEIKFISYEKDEEIIALARANILEDTIYFGDIVFLKEQNLLERLNIIDCMIGYLEEHAKNNTQENMQIEVPKLDDYEITLALNNGFDFIIEPQSKTIKHPTYILKKEIKKRTLDEPTLSRK